VYGEYQKWNWKECEYVLMESCAQANDATVGRAAVCQACPQSFWPLTEKFTHRDNRELDPIDGKD
jgi:hypothetical protein